MSESPTFQLHKGEAYHSDVNIGGVVDITTATVTLSPETHGHRYCTLNRAGGIAVTLPAAIGTGDKYHLIVKTTFTTAGTIKVVGNDTMTGVALLAQDGGDTLVAFEAAATSDTITMNGSTQGGIKGDSYELIDVSTDLWWVKIVGSATSTEATPFSSTVS